MADASYTVWLQGRTDAGRTVHIDVDPYVDRGAIVTIDGQRTPVVTIKRMRDGGTTDIRTPTGRIYWPRRIGAAGVKPGQVPTLDGEELRPL